MDPVAQEYWRKCSSCKKPLPYRSEYWVCNVSTCNRKRTGLVFCTVSCWDAHVPMMNHRESWAEERKSPAREDWERELRGETPPKVRKPKVPMESPVTSPVSSAPRVILRKKSEN